MGVDPQTGRPFVRTIENHGFERLYEVDHDGLLWTFSGTTERVRIEFSNGGNQQSHTWEWLRDGKWLPLCDRVAKRSA